MFRSSFRHYPTPAFPQGAGDIFGHRSGCQALLQAGQKPVAAKPRFFMGSGKSHQVGLSYPANGDPDPLFMVASKIGLES
jgi:hypothetical protein